MVRSYTSSRDRADKQASVSLHRPHYEEGRELCKESESLQPGPGKMKRRLRLCRFRVARNEIGDFAVMASARDGEAICQRLMYGGG